jgi:tetratricopeptide (TPR) repeat protein
MATKVKQTISAAAQQTTFLAQWGQSLAVFAFALLLYIGSMGNGYNLDDELVTRNHRLTAQGISAIPDIFSSFYYEDAMNYKYEYRPVVLTSFALEHSLFGESPKTGHVINLLLYALMGVLLLHLLQQVFKSYSPWVALGATLLFVAHPLHTEVVCSLKNRDELLALLFSLLSLRAARQFVQTNRWLPLLWTSVLFALAYMSKQSALVFLVITPLTILLITRKLNEILLVFFALFLPVVVVMALTIKLSGIGYALILIWPLFLYAVHRYVNSSYPEDNHDTLTSKFNAWLSKSYHLKLMDKAQKDFWVQLFLSALAVFVVVVLMDSQQRVYFIYFILAIFLLQTTIYQSLLLVLALSLGYHFYSGSNSMQPLLFTLFVVWAAYIKEQQEVKITHATWGLIGISTLIFLPSLYYIGIENTYIKISLFFMFLVGYLVVTQSYAKLRWINTTILLICIIGTIVLVVKSPELYLFVAIAQMATLLLITNVASFKRIAYRVSLVTMLVLSVTSAGFKFYSNNKMLTTPSAQAQRITTPKAETGLGSTADRELSFIEYPLGVHTTGSKKIGTTVGVMGHHLAKIIVPYPMSFYYGFDVVPILTADQPLAIFSIVLHLVLLFLALLLLKRHYVFSIGIFIYLVGVALYSNYFIPIPGMVADRFMFIPSLGWCIVLGYGLAYFFKMKPEEGLKNKQGLNVVFAAIVLVVLLGYSFLTYARSLDWKDHLTLMRKDVQYVTNSAQAHNLLGLNIMKYATENALPPAEQNALFLEAATHFKQSFQIYPKTFNVVYDIGRVYVGLNNTDSAIYYFQKASELDTLFPDLFLNLGELNLSKGNLRQSIPYYAKYTNLVPNVYDGYNKLSYVYFKLNEYEQSINTNRRAITNLPGNLDPYINIGQTYIAMGRKDSARVWLLKADSLSGRTIPLVKSILSDLDKKE